MFIARSRSMRIPRGAACAVAAADRNRCPLRLFQSLVGFHLIRSESHDVETDPSRVPECNRRFPLLAHHVLPDVLVKGMTSRLQHDAGFSAQLRECPLDRHDFAITRMLKARLLGAVG